MIVNIRERERERERESLSQKLLTKFWVTIGG